MIIKLLKRKYGDYTDHVGGEQSRFVTRVNVNVDSVADTHIQGLFYVWSESYCLMLLKYECK